MAAAALTLLAFGLRFLAARQSLAGDELFTLQVADRPGLGAVLDGVRGPLEITPPGFFVLAWAFGKLGDPTYWLKAPSVLAGTLTVPVTYALGAKTVGRGAGLIGGAIVAISPYAVFYGSEARAYALTGLLVTLAALLLLVALERSDAAPRRPVNPTRSHWPWWAAFAAAVAAAMYAHYVAAFPLAALVAWALVYHRDRWRPLLLACAGAALAYVPWIPGLLDDRNSPYQHAISDVWPLNLRYVGTATLQWIDGDPAWSLKKVPGALALGLLAAAAALVAGGLLLARRWRGRAGEARRSSRSRPGDRLALLIALAAAAPVLALLWSLFEPSVFVPRSFVGSLPALALLAGAAIMAVPRPVAVATGACLAVALAIGTARTLGEWKRPPFRPVADYLDRHARPGEPVLETGIFDPGQLEAHLDPARPVFRENCANPSSGPGQVLTARVHCARPGSGIAPAIAAGQRAGRLWVLSWGGAPKPVPRFHAIAVHRWNGGLGIVLAEEVPGPG
jgi:hypothetical protein